MTDPAEELPSCALCGSLVDNLGMCTNDERHDSGWRMCEDCVGQGVITEQVYGGHGGIFWEDSTCERCAGHGTVPGRLV